MKKKIIDTKSFSYAAILVIVLLVAIGAYYFFAKPSISVDNSAKKTAVDCKNLSDQKKNNDAIDCYKIILNDDSQNVDAKADLANLYLTQKNYDESTKLLTEVSQANPEDSFVLNNLGNSLRDAGKTDDAIRYYTDAISKGNSDSIANLVTIYNANAQFDKSIDLLNAELKDKPGDQTLIQLLASTYSKSGNQTKANELIKQLK